MATGPAPGDPVPSRVLLARGHADAVAELWEAFAQLSPPCQNILRLLIIEPAGSYASAAAFDAPAAVETTVRSGRVDYMAMSRSSSWKEHRLANRFQNRHREEPAPTALTAEENPHKIIDAEP